MCLLVCLESISMCKCKLQEVACGPSGDWRFALGLFILAGMVVFWFDSCKYGFTQEKSACSCTVDLVSRKPRDSFLQGQ